MGWKGLIWRYLGQLLPFLHPILTPHRLFQNLINPLNQLKLPIFPIYCNLLDLSHPPTASIAFNSFNLIWGYELEIHPKLGLWEKYPRFFADETLKLLSSRMI